MERLDRRCYEVVGLVSHGILEFCHDQVRTDDIRWVGFSRDMEGALATFREVDCDVVVHWTPGTDLMNYFLPFLPLSPVQCMGFGMHGTSGVEGIDYCVSSRLFERGEDAAEDYTETLVQFESAACWQERPRIEGRAAREEFGLPSSGALYFCPQRVAKLHPSFDTILRRLLTKDQSGHVCLLSGMRARSVAALRGRFERKLGAELAKRILFLPTGSNNEYLRLLGLMDAVLDIPSYSGALTGYDALGLGIPVVTLPGRLMVERYVFGFYQRMGITDLIAACEADYVDLAVELGCDADFRRKTKGMIRQAADLLFRESQAVREYEEFFWQVTHG